MNEPWPQHDVWLQWFGRIPHPSLAKNLDKWLKPRLWSECGWNAPWLWGHVRTKGSLAYRVVLNRTSRSSQCTCSARTQPCVHAAALLIGWQQQQWTIVSGAPLADWLPEQIPQTSDPVTTHSTASSPSWITPAKVKEMEKGYELLGQWLYEQSRLGWKNLLANGKQAAEDIASRLVDLRLPGPARMIRQLTMGDEVGSNSGILRQILARLILAQRAFTHREQLSEDQWLALLMFTGITIRKDSLRKQPAVNDRWLALTVEEYEDEADLRSRRIWCIGTRTSRFALLLDFAWKRAPFPPGLAAGQFWEGGLHFYPGADQVRAILGEGNTGCFPYDRLTSLSTWTDAHDIQTRALALDPLRMEVPVLIEQLEASQIDGRKVLLDREHHSYPMTLSDHGFELLMTSQRAHGLQLFGLLKVGSFYPVALLDQNRILALQE